MALPCNNLNLNLYRVFYTVAKTKSFSESSRTLHISQPAISKHIQNLEYELDTLLFYRTNRGIELTPEAKALLVYVEKAYNYLMIGERELIENKELKKGTISIGVPSYISIYYLNNFIKKFMNDNPNIIVRIINNDDATLLNLFDQHSIDLLIVPEDIKANNELKEVELIKEKYCFAAHKEFIVDKQISNLDSLLKEALILPSKNTKERKSLDNYLTIKGQTVNPIMELETVEMITNYTNEKLGIGYMPEYVAESNKDFVKIDIPENLPEKTINLIYNESTLTSSTKEFIELLINNK